MRHIFTTNRKAGRILRTGRNPPGSEIITKSAKERNLRIKSIANYFSKLVFSFLILKSGNVSHETFVRNQVAQQARKGTSQ